MRIGIDCGGTKIEVAALEDDGRELFRHRIPTPRGDYAGSIAAIRDLVLSVESNTGQKGTVGVGVPGSLSPATGLLRNANSTWMNQRPVDRDLSQALGRPVRVENDANCFALSEAVDGAGSDGEVVWGIIIGTGTGSGIIIRRKPLAGRNRVGGEWGHNPLPWPSAAENPGPACFCGRRGCMERWVSGPAIAEDHERVTGEKLDSAEIIARAAAGDVPAEATYQRYVDRLARGMGAVINVVDPDVIVLGGGMSNVDRLYDDLPKRLPRHVLSDVFSTPVRKAAHGDSSGVRGAAWLWHGEDTPQN